MFLGPSFCQGTGLANNDLIRTGEVRDQAEGKDALVRLGYAWDGFGAVAEDEEKLKAEKEWIRFVLSCCSGIEGGVVDTAVGTSMSKQ